VHRTRRPLPSEFITSRAEAGKTPPSLFFDASAMKAILAASGDHARSEIRQGAAGHRRISRRFEPSALIVNTPAEIDAIVDDLVSAANFGAIARDDAEAEQLATLLAGLDPADERTPGAARRSGGRRRAPPCDSSR